MKKILEEIYQVNPYSKYANKTKFDLNKVGEPLYGELTQKGTNMIIEYFKEYFNKDTVFYDLGSGLGKMVLHIGMQCKVKKSVGIEYSKERHQGAIDLQEQYAKEYNNISFLNKSYLNQNFSDATIVYIDDTACSHRIRNRVYDKLPIGCLFIFKKIFPLNHPLYSEQITVQNGTDRTYKQSNFSFLIKK